LFSLPGTASPYIYTLSLHERSSDLRRVAPFPGSANSAYGFVDLTTIPITAVQSIDILKDGASTTYGSDAIAGVVNFNFYKDYRGAQVTIQYGDTLDKDAAEYRGDILFD